MHASGDCSGEAGRGEFAYAREREWALVGAFDLRGRQTEDDVAVEGRERGADGARNSRHRHLGDALRLSGRERDVGGDTAERRIGPPGDRLAACGRVGFGLAPVFEICLLYTSDAADE